MNGGSLKVSRVKVDEENEFHSKMISTERIKKLITRRKRKVIGLHSTFTQSKSLGFDPKKSFALRKLEIKSRRNFRNRQRKRLISMCSITL